LILNERAGGRTGGGTGRAVENPVNADDHGAAFTEFGDLNSAVARQSNGYGTTVLTILCVV